MIAISYKVNERIQFVLSKLNTGFTMPAYSNETGVNWRNNAWHASFEIINNSVYFQSCLFSISTRRQL